MLKDCSSGCELSWAAEAQVEIKGKQVTQFMARLYNGLVATMVTPVVRVAAVKGNASAHQQCFVSAVRAK